MNVCSICNKTNHTYFSINKIVLKTDKDIYDIGLVALLGNISDWAFKKGMHLSGSQIVLLRPDIFRDFLEYYYSEKVEHWCFIEHLVCKACYKKYVEVIPVR